MKKSIGFYKIIIFIFLAGAVFSSLYGETSISTRLTSKIEPAFTLATSLPGTVVVNVTGTSQNIGDLIIGSNIPGTWRISISSENGGALVRDGGSERFPYRFNFGADIRGHDLSSSLVMEYFGPRAPMSVSLSLDYVSAFSLSIPAGTYRDTIVITMSAS
ncbi:MAG: hypothetical protein FD137_635 [Spirochaetes bacterium]|nr:MAG: hypothetical protein FD137_635 [Spirochaetota bacterium]